MRFTIYTALCTGNAGNCSYPNEVLVDSPAALREAVTHDHVCAAFRDHRRSNENFLQADCLVMDLDNDHTDDPAGFITEATLAVLLPDVDYALVPSRHHMLPKGSHPAAPRYHVFFPIAPCSDAAAYAGMKEHIRKRYPFFDGNALDAARFLFGCSTGEVVWHEGKGRIDELLPGTLSPGTAAAAYTDAAPFPVSDTPAAAKVPALKAAICEGSRNNTMSHFAARVLKRLGKSEEAYQSFLKRAELCKPALDQQELDAIWHSALKFYEKISAEESYTAPADYRDPGAPGSLMPADYSDLGEAKVLVAACGRTLKYTDATDLISFRDGRWREDKQRALGMVEDFLDAQLADAKAAVHSAEQALVAVGMNEKAVKKRDKHLEEHLPEEHLGLLQSLRNADRYRRAIMKFRDYGEMTSAVRAAMPMLAMDISEFDNDPELLNTPDGTVDLTKGLAGMRPHDPEDLITKMTACSPGERGKELWEKTLQRIFCGNQDLIDYVQEVVGKVAVGKVFAEELIIAYGSGANGKSTFWNTIARVLGDYYGKISAESLTTGCRHNVRPEVAELKGKRLVIASELEEGTRLSTSMLKQLCSVDAIQGEKKFKTPFFFYPSHTLVLYTNHLPKVSATDDGSWRRLIVIPFHAKITGSSDIKNYGDYLFKNAGPAILSWIIEGAEKAIHKEFQLTFPQVVVDAIEDYREENDWLGQFLDEYCELDPAYEEKSGALYQVYRETCRETGEYARNTTDFYGALKKAGFERRRKHSERVIVGLRMKKNDNYPF